MFGHRSDGRKLKTVPPFFRVIPCVMLERNYAQVYFKQDIKLKELDEYIDRKAKEGIKLSYMNIIYAAIVRIIAERPYLNRFAMNGSLYARNQIFFSLAIKKSFADEGQDNTDALAKTFSIVPNGFIRAAFKFIKFLDKHGAVPKAIISASPFHTSVFLTNVGSLGIDSIYHHLYNFGTTSLFFAMGKKKKSYIYDDDEMHEEKCITIAFVGDERICDGYYYATSFKQLSKYLKKPELLEQPGVVKEDIK